MLISSIMDFGFFLTYVSSAVAPSMVRGLLAICGRRDIDPDLVRMRISCLAEGMLKPQGWPFLPIFHQDCRVTVVPFYGFVCYLTISCLCPTKLCNATSQWSCLLSFSVKFYISGPLRLSCRSMWCGSCSVMWWGEAEAMGCIWMCACS